MKFAVPVAMCNPTELCELAIAAEQLGYDMIAMSDHLLYPQHFSVPYPYTKDGKPRFAEDTPWPDPWIAISAMAAVTKTLKFYTNVYVLPARNPVHVAKFMATLSVMTGNRVALGAGMGWMPEEFAAVHQDFAGRGKRADEMLELMQKLWTGDMVEHQGNFFQLPAIKMRPAPAAPVPVYIGGYSDAALQRAARHDGWISDVHKLADLTTLLRTVASYRETLDRSHLPFETLCFNCYDAYDLDGFRRMRDAGVTVLCTMPWFFYGATAQSPLSEKITGLQRFADDIIHKMKSE